MSDQNLHRTKGACSDCGYVTDPSDPWDLLKHGYCPSCWTAGVEPDPDCFCGLAECYVCASPQRDEVEN